MTPEIEAALRSDRTVDIITTGCKTGEKRKIEIWFFYVAGKYVITGTPGRRDWLANLKAQPEFDLCLKQSVEATLRARASLVTDREDRQYIFSAPETAWYREKVDSVSDLINDSPLVEIEFLD